MGVSSPAAFSCVREETDQGGGRRGGHPPGVHYDVMPYNAGVAQSFSSQDRVQLPCRLPSCPTLRFETHVTYGGMMVLWAMALGWLDGLFSAIHERVLYPSLRPGGEGSEITRGGKPPPPLFSRTLVSKGQLMCKEVSEGPALRGSLRGCIRVSENDIWRKLVSENRYSRKLGE